MSLTLRGGRVVFPHGAAVEADVVCDNGRIVAIEEVGRSSTAEVVDCRGLHVLPGVIDPHVHTRDPGQTYKEDLEHASAAAAAGGVTTILEMPNTIPPASDPATIRARNEEHRRRSMVDIRQWALVLGTEDSAHLAALAEAGAIAGKLFWGYAFDQRSGALVYDPSAIPSEQVLWPATNGAVRELFRAAAAANLLIGLHCEDRSILDAYTGPIHDHEELLIAHPWEAETASVATAIELSIATGARIHVLHVSSARTIELIRQAKKEGVRITAETCPHYLALAADHDASSQLIPKVFPPIRREADRRALLAAAQDGTIDSVGSDHAPHSVAELSAAFPDRPAGIPGVQTLVPVLLDLVAAGELTLTTMVHLLTCGTARVYGLEHEIGSVAIGRRANLTIVDLKAPWRVDARELRSKSRMSPWSGRTLVGRPVATIVGGRVVMRDGEILVSGSVESTS